MNSTETDHHLIYFGSNISSTENDINILKKKTSTIIDRFKNIRDSSVFVVAEFVLLYGWTTLTLIRYLIKKIDGNYKKMQQAVLNKSRLQNLTKQQLLCLMPSISQNIHVRRTRHSSHSCRSKDEIITDFISWTPTYGHTTVGRHV